MSGITLRNFLRVIYFILISSLLYSCSNDTKIRIGYIAGLTGRHSELGIGVRNGVLLAIDTLNQSGGVNGRQLEVITRDDQDDPEQAALAIQELISLKVPVIIGPLLSKMAKATLNTIKNQNVLVISPTISTDLISNINDNFLRLISEGSYQGESIAAAVIKTDFNRLAVVYDAANSEYTKPIYDIFTKRMKEAGKEVIYVNDLTDGQENNLAKVASEIVEAGCNGLFIITSGIDAAELCQQVRKHDKQIQFYGASWVKTGQVIEIGGRSVEGMILSTIFERTEKSADFEEFATKLKYMFKSEPNFSSVYAYEAVMVMAEGMKLSGSFDARKIQAAILKKGEFKGLEENFRIDQYGDAFRSKSLVQIQDGRYVRIPL